jgi:LacI family repressor for deo operon, udp, cdd, tsx, nupC, and nupG
MEPTKMPTIKEIAKRLNVSVSTVSRALSGHPRIGLQTRERVKALAQELGYEPNQQAIFFKQKKTFVIGVLIPHIREEFFSQAISGIESEAMEHQYTILFGQSFDDTEREKQIVETMRRQRVDGLIISLAKNTVDYTPMMALEKYDIPVVFFDRVPLEKNVNKVFCNLYDVTVDMVKWLMDQDRRKIALINGPEKLTASKERLKGFIQGVSSQKLKVDMQFVENTDLSRESTYTAMEKLLQQKKKPNAIITFNEYVHMDAVQYALQHQVKVNEDIFFGSYANLAITTHIAYPPIISIEQYPYKQGIAAMKMMIDLMTRKQEQKETTSDSMHQELKATLVVSGKS